MDIINTSAVEVSIHAVSPALILSALTMRGAVGASAAQAAGAAKSATQQNQRGGTLINIPPRRCATTTRIAALSAAWRAFVAPDGAPKRGGERRALHHCRTSMPAEPPRAD